MESNRLFFYIPDVVAVIGFRNKLSNLISLFTKDRLDLKSSNRTSQTLPADLLPRKLICELIDRPPPTRSPATNARDSCPYQHRWFSIA